MSDALFPSEDWVVPEARSRDQLSGHEIIVQPRGTRLRPGNFYYSEHEHKGYLKCLHCEAGMQFRSGLISTAGSSAAGQGATFTPTGGHEENCLRPLYRSSPGYQKVDRAKGYRIHLNVMSFSELFNDPAGVYEISEGGRLRIRDEDIRDRERFAVSNITDIIRLMKKGDRERLMKSVVIFGNRSVDWIDFCIIQGSTSQRFIDLSKRQLDPEAPHNFPFCVMEVHNPKTKHFAYFPTRREKVITGENVLTKVQRRALGYDIAPSIDVRGDGKWLLEAVAEEGHYLVMGLVRARLFRGDYKDTCYLNVTMTSRDQVAKVNIANLAAEARQSHERRRVRTWAVPEVPSA